MGIRNVRKEKNIANKVLIDFKIKLNKERSDIFNSLLIKLGNVSEIEFVAESISDAYSFVVNNNEFFIPFNDAIDLDEEIQKLHAEIDNRKGFLNSVLNKINNKKFMANAPEKVVQLELKKKNDAESQLKILEERLSSLSSR